MNAVPEFTQPLAWPEKLDVNGRAVFFRVQARLRVAGVWDPGQLANLMLTASSVSIYVRMHADIREARDRLSAASIADLERGLERCRMIARAALEKFGMLTADRTSLRAICGELDPEIAELCAPLPEATTTLSTTHH